jgi:methylated-DNA-protein-cysteine methyltransferase-like protein
MASDMKASSSSWQSVYRVVRRIPAGRVATYGQVAGLAGMPGAARQVGWALHALSEQDEVPWQRVINARGEISSRGTREIEDLQRALLQSEGVDFDQAGRIDLGCFGWQPRAAGSVTHKSQKSARKRTAKRAGKSALRAGEKR